MCVWVFVCEDGSLTGWAGASERKRARESEGERGKLIIIYSYSCGCKQPKLCLKAYAAHGNATLYSSHVLTVQTQAQETVIIILNISILLYSKTLLGIFQLFVKPQVLKKKKSDSEVQKFQESILAQNSFALPTSLIPSSFFPQTLPVVTGPRRSLLHNTMLLSLGEASACQLHSKTLSSYLNLFFLDSVLEQNIHVSLAGFSRGVTLAFYSH